MNGDPRNSGSRGAAPLLAAFVACALLALWVANAAGVLEGGQREAWHHYEYLAEGFAHGHTYLSVEPDPRLLKLADPYDPETNARYRLWDASLYHGKYYLYFGPAPVLPILAWRIITGHILPQRIAVGMFAAAGLAGLALLLWGVRNRNFPKLPATLLGGILVVAFHASWLPVTMRRPAVWELPIVAAAASLWWAIYFLWKFHDSGGRARWAGAAGVALALLMGSRVTFVFAAGVITLLFLLPAAGPESAGTRRWGSALPAAALAFAGGVALLIYNHARFGGWLDFGQAYQLWGEEYRGRHFFGIGNILSNAHTYLLSLPEMGPYFPFLHPYWPDDRPSRFMSLDEVYGVFFMMPVHLAGLVACGWAWRTRGTRGARAAAIAVSSAACATVFAAMIFFPWGGGCSRYLTELLAGWTVVTSIGLMEVFGTRDGPFTGRTVRILTAAAACWSIACVWLASAESRGYMAKTNPRLYGAIAHALDYPSQWWARAKGVHYGPIDMVVRIPATTAESTTVLAASGRPAMVNRLFLNRTDGANVQLVLLENDHQVLISPEIAVGGGLLHIRLEAPWLYPPPAHPYWDGLDPSIARERQTLFSIRWDSGAVQVHSTGSLDPVGFEPSINTRPLAEPGAPYVESAGPAPQSP